MTEDMLGGSGAVDPVGDGSSNTVGGSVAGDSSSAVGLRNLGSGFEGSIGVGLLGFGSGRDAGGDVYDRIAQMLREAVNREVSETVREILSSQKFGRR